MVKRESAEVRLAADERGRGPASGCRRRTTPRRRRTRRPGSTATARSTTFPRSRNSRNSLTICPSLQHGYARSADEPRAGPLPGRDPERIAEQVHVGRRARRDQARPLPVLLGRVSHRLRLHPGHDVPEGHAARRHGVRGRADLPGLRDPGPRDRACSAPRTRPGRTTSCSACRSGTPTGATWKGSTTCPPQLRHEIEHFFSIYKVPEGKDVEIQGWENREFAETLLGESRQ